MNKEIIINIFGEDQIGIIQKDKTFHGGEKMIIETSGGTMSVSTELCKKEIKKDE